MSFPNPSFIILFVKKPLESAFFYSQLFSLEPVEKSATFALFAFPNGLMLGLWSRDTARPIVSAYPGSSEICFSEDQEEKVDELYQKWNKLGIPMAQRPLAMDGMSRTFVALDPDGHRIRILCLEQEAKP